MPAVQMSVMLVLQSAVNTAWIILENAPRSVTSALKNVQIWLQPDPLILFG